MKGREINKIITKTLPFRRGGLGGVEMTEIFNKKEYTLKRKQLRKDVPKAELILWKKLKNK